MKFFLPTFILCFSFLQAQSIYATFNVVAQKDAKLAFVTSGRIENVNVEVGSIVRKSQILATLDNEDTKTLLDGAKITFQFAKRAFNRQEKIKNYIDEGKFDKVSSAYEKAKNALTYQSILYDKTFLKAPFDGVIYYKDIEVGDAVSAVRLKTIFKIQSKSERKLILEFDQKYNKVVKVGQTFEYKLDGDATKYKGVITKIYPYADFNNRKIKAEVKVKDIVVGLFGDGYILADKK